LTDVIFHQICKELAECVSAEGIMQADDRTLR
jgi:hypothetical protein